MAEVMARVEGLRLRGDEGDAAVLREEALQLLLQLRPVPFRAFRGRGPARAYLEACLANVLAEHACMVRSRADAAPGWMRRNLEAFAVDAGADAKPLGFTCALPLSWRDKGEAPLEELASCLCVYRGQCCITVRAARSRGLELVGGVRMAQLGYADADADRDDAHNDPLLYSFGSVHTTLLELSLILGLLKKPPPDLPPILTAIADPASALPVPGLAQRPLDSVGGTRFNDQQVAAVRGLRTQVQGIQGPPGTGKSTTIFLIIESRLPEGMCALVTCVQNKAVDSVAEKLASGTGGSPVLPFFVLGRHQNLGATSQYWTLDAQVDRDPHVVALERRLDRVEGFLRLIRERLRKLECKRFNKSHEQFREDSLRMLLMGASRAEEEKVEADFKARDPWRLWWSYWVWQRNPRLVVWYEELRSLCYKLDRMIEDAREEARSRLIFSAGACLCTIDSACWLDRPDYEACRDRLFMVLLDEAGTVPETKMAILASLRPSCVFAIGDHKQLPPFTTAKEDAGPLPLGLFQRLSAALPPESIPMLVTQYRMHPQICGYVSSTFYSSRLVTPPFVSSTRTAAVGEGNSAILHISYDDCEAETAGDRKKTSKVNRVEASLVTGLVLSLRGAVARGKSAMVVTFYKEMMSMLQRQADEAGVRFNTPDSTLRIVTVDAAQGSEADIVIVASVRSNPQGQLGFVSNANRTCVASSRARERLVVVGHGDTLRTNPMWRELLGCAEQTTAQQVQDTFRSL